MSQTTTKISPKNIKDYTEKTWFLGTDILDQEGSQDLDLMNDGVATIFEREEGAIYVVPQDKDRKNFYSSQGYSDYFQSIIDEAQQRGYQWVFFDRDIETEEE